MAKHLQLKSSPRLIQLHLVDKQFEKLYGEVYQVKQLHIMFGSVFIVFVSFNTAFCLKCLETSHTIYLDFINGLNYRSMVIVDDTLMIELSIVAIVDRQIHRTVCAIKR